MNPDADPVLQGVRVHHLTVDNYQQFLSMPRTALSNESERLPIPPFAHDPAIHNRFKFIDLFAGIGGIRLGFQSAGGQCVFTSEWNPWARKTYEANFGVEDSFEGDIVEVDETQVPDHDILLAGFPCQPFSIAGVSKKNALGRPHGFECTTQGTLFFDIQRILSEKRPRAFLLENVKNLLSHDGGNTFKVIHHVLEQELKYRVHVAIVDAKPFVPQHRERVLIVGFRDEADFNLKHLYRPPESPRLASILHPEDGSESEERPYTNGALAKVNPKYTLSDKLWSYLQQYADKHRAAGNGFGFGLVTQNDVARTLSARYYKDGSEILVSRGKGNPRRLTPRECARLMGFPPEFIIPVSDTQAYKQFGNSVVVPVMQSVAQLIATTLDEQSGVVTMPASRDYPLAEQRSAKRRERMCRDCNGIGVRFDVPVSQAYRTCVSCGGSGERAQ